MRTAVTAVMAVLLCGSVLAACGAERVDDGPAHVDGAGAAGSTQRSPSPDAPSSGPGAVPSAPADSDGPASGSASASPPDGDQVVVLDPGHNGGNAAAGEEINQQVPAGRGQTKPCNTTGTATDDGYSEHEFTFDVAQRARDTLTDAGYRVVLTREDDDGVGPCVDRRAEIGNEEQADAVVSIHADGHSDSTQGGFHVAYSAPPLNDAQGEPTERLATTMRAAMRGAGFAQAGYIGSDGLAPRDDLAGMNLSERPSVLVECGNMRNADEAAAMRTADGRQSYADAIADGIEQYLQD